MEEGGGLTRSGAGSPAPDPACPSPPWPLLNALDDVEGLVAQAQDPLALIANAALGWVFFYKGDFDRAISQIRATLELGPTSVLAHPWLGQALEMTGALEAAEAELRRAVDLSGGGAIYRAALARTLALRGRFEEAEILVAQVEAGRVVPAYEIAREHAALGRRADALRWLERAYEQRSHSMVLLRVDPQLAGRRDEPAYRQLLQRVGL